MTENKDYIVEITGAKFAMHNGYKFQDKVTHQDVNVKPGITVKTPYGQIKLTAIQLNKILALADTDDFRAELAKRVDSEMKEITG